MTRYDVRDNFIMTDQNTTIRYNEKSDKVEVGITDTLLPNKITFSLDPESEQGKEFMKLLQHHYLAPSGNGQIVEGHSLLLNNSETYLDRKEEIFRKYANLSSTYNDQDEAIFMCLGIGTDGHPLTVPLGTKINKPNMFFYGSHTQKYNFLSNMFKIDEKISFYASGRKIKKANVYLYNYRYVHGADYFAGMDDINRIDSMEMLLVTLRKLRKQSGGPVRDIIILDNFEELIDGKEWPNHDDPRMIRTNKAIRAEILSLIQDLTRENATGRNINFIFSDSLTIDGRYNAILKTCGAIVHTSYIRPNETEKLFGKDIRDGNMGVGNRGYLRLDMEFSDLDSSDTPRESKFAYDDWFQGFEYFV